MNFGKKGLRITYIEPYSFRMFGIPKQFPVCSNEELADYIDTYNGITDCYLSIMKITRDGSIPLFFPIDLDDHENYTNTKTDLRKILQFCMYENLNFYVTFTGMRGYHVYLPLAKKYHQKDFQVFFLYLKKNLQLEYIDSHCSQDTRRLMRIPNTIHMESGLLCSLIGYYEEGQDLQLEKYVSSDESISEFPSDCETKEFCLMHDYPCLDKEIQKKDACNFIRVAYVIKELKKGKSEFEIFCYLSSLNWDDFLPPKTKYYISYLSRKNYKPYSCSKIRKNGFCLDNCKYKCKNGNQTIRME